MKNIAVLGTGNVGQTFSTRLSGLGYQVTMGTRNVENTLAKTEKDRYGTPSTAEFLAANPIVKIDTFENATKNADLIILVTKGDGAEAALASTQGHINGKIVIDITNPLDFSKEGWPTLFTSNTSSLGEELQAKFPEAKFVKTLNTMFNGVMVNPRMLKDDSTVFMSGNFEDAKAEVTSLLKEFGWKDSEILDLGDITTARGTKAYCRYGYAYGGKPKTGYSILKWQFKFFK